jgi:Rrf2 family protein
MITREADYAIRALLALAGPAGAGRSAAELARIAHVPYPFLRRVLARLVGAGIVRSSRGCNGGMRLARPAARVSLLDVALATDVAAITLNLCLRDRRACSRVRHCAVHVSLRRVQRDLWAALDGVKLARLVRLESKSKTKTQTKTQTKPTHERKAP